MIGHVTSNEVPGEKSTDSDAADSPSAEYDDDFMTLLKGWPWFLAHHA